MASYIGNGWFKKRKVHDNVDAEKENAKDTKKRRLKLHYSQSQSELNPQDKPKDDPSFGDEDTQVVLGGWDSKSQNLYKNSDVLLCGDNLEDSEDELNARELSTFDIRKQQVNNGKHEMNNGMHNKKENDKKKMDVKDGVLKYKEKDERGRKVKMISKEIQTSQFPFSFSSSSSKEMNINIDQIRYPFEKKTFFLTGYDEIEYVQMLKKMIKNRGGIVLDDIGTDFYLSNKRRKGKRKRKSLPNSDTLPEVFVVSNSICRTKKFLLGVSLGFCAIHSNWILETSKSHNYVDIKNFLLVPWHKMLDRLIFDSISFEVSGGVSSERSFVSELIRINGGRVVRRILSFQKNGHRDFHVFVGENSNQRDFDLLRKMENVPILSKIWVYDCIFARKKLDFRSKPEYMLLNASE